MNKLYRTRRTHFSLHSCRKLEFMINTCLYQVRAIKSDSLSGSEELERRGGTHCMAEHMSLCGNYTFSNFKCYKSDFSNPEKNVEIWALAGVSWSGPEVSLDNILIKIYLYLVLLCSFFFAICTLANSSKGTTPVSFSAHEHEGWVHNEGPNQQSQWRYRR